MDSKILSLTEELLRQPAKLEEIPIQSADSALGVDALYMDCDHKFYLTEYLIFPSNLYLIFDGHAARDKHGNFDSPIFQKECVNGFKPLWQEFRERLEEKLGTSVSHIFFGDYQIGENGDEFFTVKSEPKDCHWRYTKKRKKGTIFITRISKKQALEYQDILDELRFARAAEIAQERLDREQSRLCREEAITALNSKYSEEFERFTFEAESFRFRQFFTDFLYTPTGLETFDHYYETIYKPYRDDEIADAEWREKSRQLEYRLLNDSELGPEFRFNNVHSFKLTRLDDNCCKVDSDLLDDRTGRQFSIIVKSQRFDDILEDIISELIVVFQRKKQIRRATATLQRLTAKFQ